MPGRSLHTCPVFFFFEGEPCWLDLYHISHLHVAQRQLLHGEVYTEFLAPLPPAGVLVHTPKLVRAAPSVEGVLHIEGVQHIEVAPPGRLHAVTAWLSTPFVAGRAGWKGIRASNTYQRDCFG